MSYKKNHLPVVVFINGPTATGKSDLAVEAAQKFGGEIINCDSVQVYQGVDIGTAKPTKEQLSQVPHHLFSHIPIGESYTAGQYHREALELIESGNTEIGILSLNLRHILTTKGYIEDIADTTNRRSSGSLLSKVIFFPVTG